MKWLQFFSLYFFSFLIFGMRADAPEYNHAALALHAVNVVAHEQQVYIPEDVRAVLLALHYIDVKQSDSTWSLVKDGLDVVEYRWLLCALAEAHETLNQQHASMKEDHYHHINRLLCEYQKALHNNDERFMLQEESDMDVVRSKCKSFDTLVVCKLITQCLFVKGDAVIGGDLLVEDNEIINGDLTVNGEIFGLIIANKFPTDSETAIPVGGELNIFGGENITTTGAGNTVTINVSGTTDNAVQIGNPQGSLESIAVGDDGEVLIGATGGAPAFNMITSVGGTIVITPGPNSLNIDTSGANTNQFDTDMGTALPALGILNIFGGMNIRTTGVGNTVTIHVAGTTNHAVQVGNSAGSLTSIPVGTNGQVLLGATGADPAFNDLTSPNGTIVFTPGINSLGLDTAGTVATSYNTNIAGPAVPVAGVLNVLGGNDISTTGAGNTITINISGTTQDALQIGDATGGITSLPVATNGQIPIGSTGAAPVIANITPGAGVAVTNGAGSITIALSGSGAGAAYVQGGNTFGATGTLGLNDANTLNIRTNSTTRISIDSAGAVTVGPATAGVTLAVTGNAASTAQTITAAGAQTALDILAGNINLTNSTTANTGNITKVGVRFLHNFGTNNTFLGGTAGNFGLTGTNNTGTGFAALTALTSGNNNTALGSSALAGNTTGSCNVAIGSSALAVGSATTNNVAIGCNSLDAALSGDSNVGIGTNALGASTSANDNIAIGVGAGSSITTGDQNVLIGTNAGSTYVSGTTNIVIGYNITGGAVAESNAIRIGTGVFLADTNGFTRFLHNAGTRNTFLGANVGNLALGGGSQDNTGVGYQALLAATSGDDNTAVGANALTAVTSGVRNTAVGKDAGLSITTGDSNTMLGEGAGTTLTTGSNNIYIGRSVAAAVAAEANTIRIGNATNSRCFITGIRGVVTGVANAIPVLIDSANQLGTVSSSIRYKDDVKDIEDISFPFMQLRPVAFHYKADEYKTPQYGLIAEEVEKLFPELVVYNEKGQPETLQYHLLYALLIKMIQENRKLIEELQQRI